LSPNLIPKYRKNIYTLEEFLHGLEVELVGAIEDHALNGERLGQVLGSFGFAGAGGSLGSPAVDHLVSAHESAVAAVGERGDDQSRIRNRKRAYLLVQPRYSKP